MKVFVPVLMHGANRHTPVKNKLLMASLYLVIQNIELTSLLDFAEFMITST